MRWGECSGHVIAGLGLVALATAGCTDDVVRAEVIDYAEGDWRCELALPYEATSATPDDMTTMVIDATVEATGDAEGNVTFTVGGPLGDREMTGTWELDGTDLQVDTQVVEASYAMAGVDIATDGIEIQEDDPDADLVPVDVEREGDTVIFGWDDPWLGDPAEMSCTKE